MTVWPRRCCDLSLCLLAACCSPNVSTSEMLSPPALGGTTAGAVGVTSTGAGAESTSSASSASATACPLGPYAASPLPADANPFFLADTGVDWSEGPVWVRAGQYLLFSAWSNETQDAHGPRTTLYQFTPGQGLQIVSPMAVLRTNGMAITDSGDLLVATDGDSAATNAFDRGVQLMPGAQLMPRTYLANSYEGLPFDAPNDLTVRHDGTVYFTDTDYQQGNPPRPGQPQTRVYRIDTAGQVTVVDPSRPDPNGIALSIDQKTLYVGAADNQILAYPVHTDGGVGTPSVFADTGTDVDGMSVDCAGNLYASLPAQQKLAIYSPAGELLGSIALPQQNSNVAFGGADMRTLFLTVSGKLYGLTMPIPGWPY